jgi:hypothetical protein
MVELRAQEGSRNIGRDKVEEVDGGCCKFRDLLAA